MVRRVAGLVVARIAVERRAIDHRDRREAGVQENRMIARRFVRRYDSYAPSAWDGRRV